MNAQNRLKDAGPQREIEVGALTYSARRRSVPSARGSRVTIHIQGWTAYDYPGREDKVRGTLAVNPMLSLMFGISTVNSNGRKNTSRVREFAGVDEITIDLTHAPQGVDWDNKAKESGIYRITGKGHKGWSSFVDKELGNYDFLLGIDVSLFIVHVHLILFTSVNFADRLTIAIPMSNKIKWTGVSGFSRSALVPQVRIRGTRCISSHFF